MRNIDPFRNRKPAERESHNTADVNRESSKIPLPFYDDLVKDYYDLYVNKRKRYGGYIASRYKYIYGGDDKEPVAFPKVYFPDYARQRELAKSQQRSAEWQSNDRKAVKVTIAKANEDNRKKAIEEDRKKWERIQPEKIDQDAVNWNNSTSGPLLWAALAGAKAVPLMRSGARSVFPRPFEIMSRPVSTLLKAYPNAAPIYGSVPWITGVGLTSALASCKRKVEREDVLQTDEPKDLIQQDEPKDLIQQGDSVTAINIQIPFIHEVENPTNKNYDSKSNRYYAYPATENPSQLDIGDGLKLFANPKVYKIYNNQIDEKGRHYITKEQHDNAVRERCAKDYANAKKVYNQLIKKEFNEENAWDDLNSKEKAFLMDYEYNAMVGVAGFPKLMKAIYSKDLNAIKKECLRYEVKRDDYGNVLSKKELGRNKTMLERADELYVD